MPYPPRPRRATRTILSRALIMLAALQEGDVARDDLIARVRAEMGESAYGAAPEDAFLRDIAWLRELGFDVGRRTDDGRYHLEGGHNPLLRLKLAPDEVYALSLLRRAFERTPYARDVASLVSRIASYLPPDQQAQVNQPTLLSVLVPVLDEIEPHRQTLQKVQEATRQRRQLEFEYRSRASEKSKRHVVTVYDSLELREGHVYFQAHSDRTDSDLEFRLDHVVPGTVQLLPAKVTSAEKPRRPLTLRYRLSKEFARQGATRRFRNHTEEREADGSLVVTAEIDETELFWASKTLLKYGASCVVLEPPELVAEMKRVVEQMALNYREAYS